MMRVLNEIATLSIHLHINSEKILIKKKLFVRKSSLKLDYSFTCKILHIVGAWSCEEPS